MESVDMYIDESQQAEPEENLDISEAGEEKTTIFFSMISLRLMLNSRQKFPGMISDGHRK